MPEAYRHVHAERPEVCRRVVEVVDQERDTVHATARAAHEAIGWSTVDGRLTDLDRTVADPRHAPSTTDGRVGRLAVLEDAQPEELSHPVDRPGVVAHHGGGVEHRSDVM